MTQQNQTTQNAEKGRCTNRKTCLVISLTALARNNNATIVAPCGLDLHIRRKKILKNGIKECIVSSVEWMYCRADGAKSLLLVRVQLQSGQWPQLRHRCHQHPAVTSHPLSAAQSLLDVQTVGQRWRRLIFITSASRLFCENQLLSVKNARHVMKWNWNLYFCELLWILGDMRGSYYVGSYSI